jgi:hypothetical protein
MMTMANRGVTTLPTMALASKNLKKISGKAKQQSTSKTMSEALLGTP